MPTTPVALYRKGNASSPRMDHVRPNDIAVSEQQGELWVMPTLEEGKLSGGMSRPEGISTYESPGSGKNWYKLDLGTDIPPELELVNDRDGHWLFQPSRPMTLEKYKEALHLIGTFFCKIE
ncbi:Tse2 family ADP-ribosyltransferase toxin [Microcoleus sp. Pol10D4]|uniref:Tse2 family ADP-ribosyltransferase toxin n=1 Tax=Microcoleus sp. Pol10D4 TaxID=3055387 RepID=UPI002FD6B3F1